MHPRAGSTAPRSGTGKPLRAILGPTMVTAARSSDHRPSWPGQFQVNSHQARSLMATYVSLFHWTDQGVRNVKDSPKRLESTRKALKKLGGELKAFYMLQGNYDGILIFDVP